MHQPDANAPCALALRAADPSNRNDDAPPVPLPEASKISRSRRLHRLKTVREREQISRRTIARRLGVGIGEVKRQEDETRDIVLSQLLRWQHALDVPLADLLLDPDRSLSPAIRDRAALLRSMKTAKLILKLATGERVVRLARMLTEQLTTLMPELRGVSAWPVQGKQRAADEWGIVAERPVPDDVFAAQCE